MSIIEERMAEHKVVLEKTFSVIPQIEQASKIMCDAVSQRKKIVFFGNGGSAADAQHLAAELMGRFQKEREPYPALALTVDTSVLTAIGNDYGYDVVFARQVRGIGNKGDVAIGLSTSGSSKNVVSALAVAKKMGMKVIGFTGENSGKMAPFCDVCISVPTTVTARIQEMHIMIGHILCEIVEQSLIENN